MSIILTGEYIFGSVLSVFFFTVSVIEAHCSKSAQERFQVYWNVPTSACASTDVGLTHPERYGIRVNENETWYGSHIVTFYEDKLGLYPKCIYEKQRDRKYVCTKMINGGLPMLQNLKDHLKVAEKDIANAIPDVTFSGIAVIDYEHWRPVFSHNWGPRAVYKTETIKMVRQKYPQLTFEECQQLAEKLWNTHAKDFFLETLRLGKRLRPNAKWGFYDFPLCDFKNKRGNHGSMLHHCKPEFTKYNDEMLWLFEETVALYPSIYFYRKPQDDKDLTIERNCVFAKIEMARQYVNKFPQRFIPVYVFAKQEYNEYKQDIKFYTADSRCLSYGFPADYALQESLERGDGLRVRNFSIQGAIIWSTSHRIEERCAEVKANTERGLGKFLIKYYTRSNRCSKKLCNSHGRCVMDASQQPLNISWYMGNVTHNTFACHHFYHSSGHYPTQLTCLCDAGYSGAGCEIRQNDLEDQQFSDYMVYDGKATAFDGGERKDAARNNSQKHWQRVVNVHRVGKSKEEILGLSGSGNYLDGSGDSSTEDHATEVLLDNDVLFSRSDQDSGKSKRGKHRRRRQYRILEPPMMRYWRQMFHNPSSPRKLSKYTHVQKYNSI